MKIALQWLSQYLPGPLDAQTAADALTHGGLPVEVIETVAGDTVIDVEVTSNRGDCLSHVGVARELAALLNRPFNDVTPASPEVADPASAEIDVAIDAADLCPHYTARLIKGVKIGPSPRWMQQRLESVGLRAINNVVDVTNYVMFELGQPLHAFDYDKAFATAGGGKKVVVRRAKPGEKLVTIDGKQATLQPDYLAICNATSPVALAGVMGGLESEVSDRTVNVLLEAARFDPLAVRKAARAIVRSDSSYRFERGIDPLLPEKASLRAAQLIIETAGGQLLSGLVSAGATGYTPRKLTLRLARLKQVLGVEFPLPQVMEALTRLRLAPVAVRAGEVEVTIPSYRLDLNIEVDLVEEVARIIGYDKVPVRDEISIRIAPTDPKARSIETIRDTMVAGGYFESVTVGFVVDSLATDFLPADADPQNPLPRASPVTRKENAALRPSILPGLLESVRRNDNAGVSGAKLFEIGSTFYHRAGGTVVEQQKLGVVGSADLREVRGVVEAVLGKLDANRDVKVVPAAAAGYARGASGRVEWGGQAVGYIGRLDKTVAEKLGLRDRPCIAEIEIAPLLAGAQHVPQLKPLPQFPPAERDLSLVVAEQVKYEQVEQLVRAVNPPNLESASFVTTYRGKPLEKGTKSVTLKLVFRSTTGTLTSEQVEQAVSAVVDKAKADLGATLRA